MKTKTVASRIPLELYDWLQQKSTTFHVTVSDVILSLIKSSYNKEIKKQQSPNRLLQTKSCSTNVKQQQQLQPAVTICDTFDKTNEELDRQIGSF